ncbi:hypothetical protein CC78DRAFT_225328 [Lojkania enalia]|uniref:Uncharacterized protein n=1 Tax=Lojkania enalia TaxID=147567 RepID=A0A9P4KA81_9PLEO|nr:hypothetical protein CC78DRAFT_225328 [Didymosphaeria enalia]
MVVTFIVSWPGSEHICGGGRRGRVWRAFVVRNMGKVNIGSPAWDEAVRRIGMHYAVAQTESPASYIGVCYGVASVKEGRHVGPDAGGAARLERGVQGCKLRRGMTAPGWSDLTIRTQELDAGTAQTRARMVVRTLRDVVLEELHQGHCVPEGRPLKAAGLWAVRRLTRLQRPTELVVGEGGRGGGEMNWWVGLEAGRFEEAVLTSDHVGPS